MQPKLILIEGLPGSGKSTTAEKTYEFLKSQHIPVEVYSEGNLDHPADYDGVAYFTRFEWETLLYDHPHYKKLLEEKVIEDGDNMFLSYAKLQYEQKANCPDDLMDKLSRHDIYEQPLDLHIELITNKWKNFVQQAKKDNKTYIFECCFIQNPVTTTLVKHNASKQIALDYVMGLAKVISHLEPLLIYVDQKDIDFTFRKALSERSKGWADFFINYYTSQGYGQAEALKGIEGTIEVLKQRALLEKEIMDQLNIEKNIIDNSNYNQTDYQKMLEKLLAQYFLK